MRATLYPTSSIFVQPTRFKALDLSSSAAYVRSFSNILPLSLPHVASKHDEQDNGQKGGKEEGAMSKRLAEMTEETIDRDRRSAAQTVEAAGFSEELKKKLEARIADGAFRTQNQRALSEAEIPVRILFYCCFSMQFLTGNSPPQAKAREIMRLLNRGWDPNLSTTQAYVC